MRSLWTLRRAPTAGHSAAVHTRLRRSILARCSGLYLLLLILAGCGTPVHLPVDGPGLRLVVAQGSQGGTLRFWWLPPDTVIARPRLLLWDGTSVGVSDPAALNQSFAPLGNRLACSDIAVAPDHHAFACGLPEQGAGSVLLQSLDHPTAQPDALLDEHAPFAWAPDSQHLAALRTNFAGSHSTCSVVTADTTPTGISSDIEQVLLAQIPFNDALSKGASTCPIVDMAWSPDGSRLALSLAVPNGVIVEVLLLGANGQPPVVETHTLLPGIPLQAVDMPGVSSLLWAPDSQTLTVLTGQQPTEDNLFLLPAGQQSPLSAPHVIDTGSGAALAFSPDGHWLAAGTVGSFPKGENALLQVLNVANGIWQSVVPMFVAGSTLTWSPDSTMLAAASVSRKGIAIWNWPTGTLKGLALNPDITDIEQLAWAQDGATLFFTLGSHANLPVYDELYAQALPIPPGVSSFAFPAWFSDLLALLPQALIVLGGGLLLACALLAVTLGLARSGQSRRKRALSRWALGVDVALIALVVLLIFNGDQLPGWLNRFYQPASDRLCQRAAPDACNQAAILTTLALIAPLLLGLLVVLVGGLVTGRKPRPAAAQGAISLIRHPFLQGLPEPPPGSLDKGPLLLPPGDAPPASNDADEDEYEQGRWQC